MVGGSAGLGAFAYSTGKWQRGRSIGASGSDQPFEGLRVDAIVDQIPWKVIGDVFLRENGRVPKIVANVDPQAGCGLRVGAMPRGSGQCDE